MTYLTNLRSYAQRKGSVAAGALSEIQCWRELARVSGVNSYQNMTKLQAMRAMLVKGGVSGSASMNEMVAMRKLANLEGCAPVEGLGMGPVMAALASPAQFIFNQEGGDGDSFLTVTNAEKLALTGIPVGQIVHITDGLTITGAIANPTVNTFYKYFSQIFDLPAYIWAINTNVGTTVESTDFSFNNPVWQIVNDDAVILYSSDDFAAFPWDSHWTSSGLTLTHPAVQHYLGTDPSDENNWAI